MPLNAPNGSIKYSVWLHCTHLTCGDSMHLQSSGFCENDVCVFCSTDRLQTPKRKAQSLGLLPTFQSIHTLFRQGFPDPKNVWR